MLRQAYFLLNFEESTNKMGHLNGEIIVKITTEFGEYLSYAHASSIWDLNKEESAKMFEGGEAFFTEHTSKTWL